ncbi:DUF3836 domain-containing protein [Bacteroides ihuae]|uniref:DUF3836 domain-containing protein n=1 Tax=Bacteroides ihuae TaxID=1852362 RepID=UPI0008D8E0DD|nr:DUF3836 domain-containing protein [Bacteroides ihuae]
MKATMFINKVIVLVTLFLSVSGLASAANNNDGEKNFIYNDVLKDGKVVSREMYLLEKGTSALAPIKKCEYVYNEAKQLKEKTTYKWNSSAMKWEKESLLSISYTGTETIVENALWIPSKNVFSPSDKQVYVTSVENNMISQYNYKMNKRTKVWELQKSENAPTLENLLAKAE